MDKNIQPVSFNVVRGHIGDFSSSARELKEGKERALDTPGDSITVSKTAAKKQRLDIKVNVLTQDPEVGPPKTIDFPQEKIGDKVSGERIAMIDKNYPKAIPDIDGNYLFDVGTAQFDQVNSFTVAYRTLDMFENYKEGRIDWAFKGDRLFVLPHKQQGKNAYYSRYETSVNFWYFDSPPLAKTVQTSEAADIVSHETGHAALDGIRPGYLGWDSETMAVHEAFGDITAMLFALQDPDNIKMTLEQNGGDFRKESMITRLGEEFGKAIHLEDSNPDNDDKIYLRSMLNDFKYSDPDSLPDDHNSDHLSGEPHSFSRVLSGAMYDILDKMYAGGLSTAQDPAAALASARDTMGKLFIKSFDHAPEYECKYKDVALGMIKVDRFENGGANEQAIKDVFMERGIITQQDVDELDKQMASVPNVSLRKNQINAQQVQSFLAEHGDSLGLPDGLNMQLLRSSQNKKGVKFVNLGFTREMLLDGKEYGKYEGYAVDVSGGLTLAFNKQGKLIDFSYDPIDEAKKEDVRRGVIDSINKGLVKEKGEDDIFKTDTEIYKGEVIDTPSGRKKIVRILVISYR